MNLSNSSASPADFGEAAAREADRADPLSCYRERFHIPPAEAGGPAVYFCGNSLGLQPVTAASRVDREMEDWRRLAVDAHFHGKTPWFSYHEVLRDVQFRVAPLTTNDVDAMIRGIRGRKLLDGYRSHPPADIDALREVVLRVSKLVEEVPEIHEMDLNPLIALPPGEGCRVVDARVLVRP